MGGNLLPDRLTIVGGRVAHDPAFKIFKKFQNFQKIQNFQKKFKVRLTIVGGRILLLGEHMNQLDAVFGNEPCRKTKAYEIYSVKNILQKKRNN